MHIPTKLYRQILKAMPIPCVDLLVTDRRGRVLLVKRANEPAKGQWWFPGGRVQHLETRVAAATRKLREECGLEATSIREVGTFDVFLDSRSGRNPSHGITTLFALRIGDVHRIRLDGQSTRAEWRTVGAWTRVRLHPFVSQQMALARRKRRA